MAGSLSVITLSILFLRFFLGILALSSTYIPFNSLFEIPMVRRNEGEEYIQFAFNSLFEILSIGHGIGAKPVTATFNSLFEILCIIVILTAYPVILLSILFLRFRRGLSRRRPGSGLPLSILFLRFLRD